MKKSIWKKASAFVLAAALAVGVFAGCSQSDDSSAAAADSDTGDTVTTIKVGTGSGIGSLWYEDDDGNFTGYCVEMLRAIDEKLPQYEFELVQHDGLAGVLTALDAGKVRIGEYLFSKTDEREAKYLFGDVGYWTSRSYITTLADRDDLNSIADFAGKVIGVIQGEAFENALIQWNEAHPGQEIIIEYIPWGTDEENYSLLASGRVDGLTDGTAYTVATWNSSFGNGEDVVKLIDEAVLEEEDYLLFNQDDTELKEACDQALQELKDEGTLSELSIQFLGYDVTQ
jgi:ABC-type amino acid transport substrate-binding protein